MSVLPRDHKRFAQLVRKLVRDYVRKEREAPGLTLWVSSAGDPRAAAAAVRIGAAVDANAVRYAAVEAIDDADAMFAAIGRRVSWGDTGEELAVFGLLVWAQGVERPLAGYVPVVAGRMEGWEVWEPSAAQLEGFGFVPAALGRVARRRALEEGAGDVGPAC